MSTPDQLARQLIVNEVRALMDFDTMNLLDMHQIPEPDQPAVREALEAILAGLETAP